MRDYVEIGLGRMARRGYDLAEVSIIPSRRTRDIDDVSISWQIDAFAFEIPMVAAPSDAVTSPDMCVAVGRCGGLGVLNAEGLWTRYDDPEQIYARIADLAETDSGNATLQEIYAEPVKPDLISARIKEIKDAGVVVAARVSPQHTTELAPVLLSAGVDILVIQGTIVSAEHVTDHGEGLNLKEFIADLDVPVIVGGCADYHTALHLMRTGAAGVLVGLGADPSASSDQVLGIRVPMATAIADAVAARRDYLDETGGRYVHVLANGEIATSGDIARALACGADAVVVGEPLRTANEVPAAGQYWESVAAHPRLPRGGLTPAEGGQVPLAEVLFGPSSRHRGRTNLFGALSRTLAKTGYRDLKEFQKVDLVLSRAVRAESEGAS